MNMSDIPGFCKRTTLEEIREHGNVLTPGRYVGAEAQEDDGEPFEEKITRLTERLADQMAEGKTAGRGYCREFENSRVWRQFMSVSDEEIRRQLRLGEDNRWEFKEIRFAGNVPKQPSRDDLADEIAAFANTEGGVLLWRRD